MPSLVPQGMDSVTGQPRIAQATDALLVSHLMGASSAPTVAIGTGAGTTGSPSATISGTDLGGSISITTGTVLTPVAGGTVCTVTFNFAGAAAPKAVIITPANSVTALLSGTGSCFVNQAGLSSSTFAITAGTTALIGVTIYQFYYAIIW